ncbi:hypothetical protein ACLOJK_026025 [Asimina triloba]
MTRIGEGQDGFHPGATREGAMAWQLPGRGKETVKYVPTSTTHRLQNTSCSLKPQLKETVSLAALLLTPLAAKDNITSYKIVIVPTFDPEIETSRWVGMPNGGDLEILRFTLLPVWPSGELSTMKVVFNAADDGCWWVRIAGERPISLSDVERTEASRGVDGQRTASSGGRAADLVGRIAGVVNNSADNGCCRNEGWCKRSDLVAESGLWDAGPAGDDADRTVLVDGRGRAV